MDISHIQLDTGVSIEGQWRIVGFWALDKLEQICNAVYKETVINL